MRIRYIGQATVRILGPYTWSPENGHVQSVDAETAANLLTYPRPQFQIDPDEPLMVLKGVGEQRMAELALAGIARIGEMAALDEDGIKRLADQVWASEKQIRVWVEQARNYIKKQEE